jgi:hypothetical protein
MMQHSRLVARATRLAAPSVTNTWTVKGIGTSLLLVRGFRMIECIVRVGGTQRKVILEKVLYVPGLGTNLLSIAAVKAHLHWGFFLSFKFFKLLRL